MNTSSSKGPSRLAALQAAATGEQGHSCTLSVACHSEGFGALNNLLCPKAINKRSVACSMYFIINSLSMPIKSHGKASQLNFLSACTAPFAPESSRDKMTAKLHKKLRAMP